MNDWAIICHVSEVGSVGDYVLLPWAVDEEVVVTRNEKGLYAFDNRCPHRGARIFNTVCGNQPPKCTYHGRLASPENVNLFQLQIIDGWVIVCRSKIAPAPEWAYVLREIVGTPSTLRLHEGVILEYPCHWTVAVENALDLEHAATVHKFTLGALGLKTRSLKTFADGSSFETFDAEQQGMLARLCHLFENPTTLDYFHLHMMPGVCLSSTRGTTYSLQHYFPRQDGTTLLMHRLYSTPTKVPAKPVLEAIFRFNRQVFEEDGRICSMVRPFHNGQLAPYERRISHFRSAVEL